MLLSVILRLANNSNMYILFPLLSLSCILSLHKCSIGLIKKKNSANSEDAPNQNSAQSNLTPTDNEGERRSIGKDLKY